MLKDEQDCCYNGGGDARPLKTWSYFSSATRRSSDLELSPGIERKKQNGPITSTFGPIINLTNSS